MPMSKRADTSLSAEFGLLFVAACWGLRYSTIKDVILNYSGNFINFIRFGGGAAVLAACMWRKFSFTKRSVLIGSFLGVNLFLGTWIQTKGLEMTTASEAAFLSSTAVIMIPFFAWLFCREKVHIYNWIAAILTLGGVGLISLAENFSFSKGNAYILLCALMSGLAVLFLDKEGKKPGAHALTISFCELAAAGVCFFLSVTVTNAWPHYATVPIILELIFLSVICAGVCNTLYTVCIRHTNATRGAVILSMETVFAALFGVLLMEEKISLRSLIGALLIFSAGLITLFHKLHKDPQNPAKKTK